MSPDLAHALIVAAVTGLASFAGGWGGVRARLYAVERAVDRANQRIDEHLNDHITGNV